MWLLKSSTEKVKSIGRYNIMRINSGSEDCLDWKYHCRLYSNWVVMQPRQRASFTSNCLSQCFYFSQQNTILNILRFIFALDFFWKKKTKTEYIRAPPPSYHPNHQRKVSSRKWIRWSISTLNRFFVNHSRSTPLLDLEFAIKTIFREAGKKRKLVVQVWASRNSMSKCPCGGH